MLFAVAVAHGAEVFTVDPEASTIALSGSVTVLGNRLDFAPQGPGSLTTRYTGTLLVERTPTSLRVVEGSTLEALNSGDWEPKSDGSVGTEPANYGAMVSTLFVSAKAALRRLKLDVSSPAVPLNNGAFDSAGFGFTISTNSGASLDYRASGLLSSSGSEPLSGYSTNRVTTGGTLISAGGTETLTIPVDAEYKFDLLSSGDTTVNVTGTLLARRSAEPPFRIDGFRLADGALVLDWTAAAGTRYEIQSSSNLTSWAVLAELTPTASGAVSWTNTATSEPRQFLRLAK